MIRLLIISDDFTGALDTGVQLAASGASTRVVTDPAVDLHSAGAGCEVLVIDAETRHLPPKEAYRIVYCIVEQAVRCGVPHIYKKTDSALRGNIGAELTALLDASGARQLPFLPAFPQIGRSTVDGIHYIRGVPVADSVFGADPFEPVRHSGLRALLAEQSSTPVQLCPALGTESALPQGRGIQVYDAENLEELACTGRRLLEAGRLNIMAGCAGFGAVLPNLLRLGDGGSGRAYAPPLDPRMLVVCGSVNPITLEQLNTAERAGFLRLRLTPAQKLESGHWETVQGKKELAALCRAVEHAPRCILDSNDAQGNQPTAAYAAVHGMQMDDIRVAASRSIGQLVSRLFDGPAPGTVLITGGDTLLQCMNSMGVHEMEPLCELQVGVVLSRFCRAGHTRYLLSKSGGFGGADLLIDLASQIARSSEPGKQ
jgi:uncharacterized protein YgbK (DUF1537 family)